MAEINVVATYDAQWQAALARNELLDADIWCAIEDALAAVNLGLPSAAIGGIKVVVRAEDVDRALSILDGEHFAHMLENDHDDDEPEEHELRESRLWSRNPKCPKCNSDNYKLGPVFHYYVRGSILLAALPILAMRSYPAIVDYYFPVVLTLVVVGGWSLILKLFPLECQECGYVGPTPV